MQPLHGWRSPSFGLLPLAMGNELFGDEVAEGGDPLGLAQFLGIGEEHRNLGAFDLGQDTFDLREILDHARRSQADDDVS